MVSRLAIAVVGVLTVSTLANPALAQNKCASKKIKATGGKAACLLGLEAKEASKGAPKDAGKAAACGQKLIAAFGKAEAKAKVPCLTTGDAAAIEAKVDAFVSDLDVLISGASQPPPASKCQSAKIKAASSKTKCLLGLEAKEAAKAEPKDPAKVQKCLDKFNGAFAKASTGSDCGSSPNAATVEAAVDAFITDADDELNLPPVDCSACDCCSALPSTYVFTVSPPGGAATGSVSPARCVQGSNNGTACTTDGQCTGGGVCRGDLARGALYFGSGQPAGINLPATVPDMGQYVSKVTSCTGCNPNLTPTTAAEIGSGCSEAGTPSYGSRHCTSPGCLYGAPLAIPNFANPPTTTCIVNEIAPGANTGKGTLNCATGATTLDLPLISHVYLTGSVLGTQACATCTGGSPGMCGSGTCQGGARNGLACTPETTALNGSYPTSHDCPPPAGTFIGDLPIPYALSTGTQSKTSFATSAQPRVFCGFCFDPNVSSAFESPPHPCTSDAQCTTGDFTSCRQHNNGAFRNSFATTITETGAEAGVCVASAVPYPSTLVSVFCVPPSYDPIVDPSGELPGPGAVSLPGTGQFVP
jgi:hypothetical protein